MSSRGGDDQLDEEDEDGPAKKRLQEMKSAPELDLELVRLEANKKTPKIARLEELQDLKGYLKSTVGIPFCTNLLRIALNLKETSCASCIVAFYHVQIDQKMMIRAIKTNQM